MNLSNNVIQNQMEKENHQLYKDQSCSSNLSPDISSSPNKIKGIIERTKQILENYWRYDEPDFELDLKIFNLRRHQIKTFGINYFLKKNYLILYDRYDGYNFVEFLDSIESVTSINAFEETNYWSKYIALPFVFREYIHYLGELGYTASAGRW